MVQEVYKTKPLIRDACNKSISDHAATVEVDIAEAMQKYGIVAEWTAESLRFTGRRSFKVPLFLQRPKVDRKLPLPASIIFAYIWRCSFPDQI
jgi:TetR/AcrR family transcriptional repressor of nem operon